MKAKKILPVALAFAAGAVVGHLCEHFCQPTKLTAKDVKESDDLADEPVYIRETKADGEGLN